jgi:hypothetical protein
MVDQRRGRRLGRRSQREPSSDIVESQHGGTYDLCSFELPVEAL